MERRVRINIAVNNSSHLKSKKSIISKIDENLPYIDSVNNTIRNIDKIVSLINAIMEEKN